MKKYQIDYFGFVYLWRDSETKRFYIGSHYGSTTDGYIASSKWLKAAYKKRPCDFKRRILQFLTNDGKKLLLQMEQSWLDLITDQELGQRYFNLKKLAAGGNGKFKTVCEILPTTCELCKQKFCSRKNSNRVFSRFCSRSCNAKFNSMNTDRASNGRKGALRMSLTAQTRCRVYNDDGSWGWGRSVTPPTPSGT